MSQVLLLNQSYQPLNIITFKRALKMFVKGKIEIMSHYDDKVFNCWGTAMNAPAVVRMKYFVKLSNRRSFDIPLTRKNILERDNGKCQYCSQKLTISQLTFDHVIPRVQGGTTTWENVVASCSVCNTKKGGNTPKQANMRLLNVPERPNINDTLEDGLFKKLKMMIGSRPPANWQDYIYWNIELEQD